MERWCARVVSAVLGIVGCTTSDADATSPLGSTGTTSDIAPSSSDASGAVSGRCEDEGWPVDSGGDSGDEAGDDTGVGMGDDMPLPLTIPQIQQGDAPALAWVALDDVVVTTPSAASAAIAGRELFVQEREGGAFSGLRVVSVGFDLGELAAPGDPVDLVGQIYVDRSGFVLLRIEREDRVTPGSDGAEIVPTPVTIADLDPANPDARRFEGVVVRIVDATVTEVAGCEGELVVDDTLIVDDRFVPGHLAAFDVGARLAAVRGVFLRASGSYELAPPATDAIE